MRTRSFSSLTHFIHVWLASQESDRVFDAHAAPRGRQRRRGRGRRRSVRQLWLHDKTVGCEQVQVARRTKLILYVKIAPTLCLTEEKRYNVTHLSGSEATVRGSTSTFCIIHFFDSYVTWLNRPQATNSVGMGDIQIFVTCSVHIERRSSTGSTGSRWGRGRSNEGRVRVGYGGLRGARMSHAGLGCSEVIIFSIGGIIPHGRSCKCRYKRTHARWKKQK
jgi:hypothetical protein